MKNRYLLALLAISGCIFIAQSEISLDKLLKDAEKSGLPPETILSAKLDIARKQIFETKNLITQQLLPKIAGKQSESELWIELLNEVRAFVDKRAKSDYDNYWIVISNKSDELLNALRINFQANIKPGIPANKPHGTKNFDEIDLSKVNFADMVKEDKATGKYIGIIGELLDKAEFLATTSYLLSEKSGWFESTAKRQAREMLKILCDDVAKIYGKALDDFNEFAKYATKKLKKAMAKIPSAD